MINEITANDKSIVINGTWNNKLAGYVAPCLKMSFSKNVLFEVVFVFTFYVIFIIHTLYYLHFRYCPYFLLYCYFVVILTFGGIFIFVQWWLKECVAKSRGSRQTKTLMSSCWRYFIFSCDEHLFSLEHSKHLKQDVLRELQGCLMGVCLKFQGCLEVSRKF